MKRLFISDLHLWESEPDIEALFHQFMTHQAQDADELYVLGDLFEAWIGDDAIDELAKRVINSFSQYSSQGRKLFFMHGNRDFLLAEHFAEATGGTFLNDPYSLTLNNLPALLMHGDSLCTDDEDYIKFRTEVRSTQWQSQFLSLSIDERQTVARNIRNKSIEHGQEMNAEISDVAQAEVERVMSEMNVELLIHGHTHRQDRHQFFVQEKSVERIVLGDWGKVGNYLCIENNSTGINSIDLINFSLL